MDTSILVMLVDKSGSMSGIADDAIGSFNSFLEKQREVPGEARMFVGLFDTSVQSYAIDAKLEDVKPLDSTSYRPNGNTALLDAIGMTVDTVSSNLNKYGTPKVLLAILTDGQENSSVKYNYSRIRELLDSKKNEGWDIIFLADGLDAAQEASKLGISSTRTAMFSKGSAANGANQYVNTMNVLDTYATMYRTSDTIGTERLKSMDFAAAITAANTTIDPNLKIEDLLKEEKKEETK